MGLLQKIKTAIIEEEASPLQISITDYLDYKTLALIDRVWYGGKEYKLEQLHSYLDYPTSSGLFWKAKPSKNNRIRKLHTGVPALMVDILSKIIIRDMNDITIEEEEDAEYWKMFASEENFKKKLSKALKQTMVVGDGAFRVVVDSTVSPYPILEFWRGDRIDIKCKHDKLQSITFISHFREGNKEYAHKQIYGYGYIRNELYYNNELLDLGATKITQELEDFEFDKKVILTVPIMFYESEDFENRGKSIYSGKLGNFDALDEAWSQWMDALRSGRTKTYIPEDLIPRDPENGRMRKPNPYDNQFFDIANNGEENGSNKIEVTDPEIKADKYLQTYITALDLSLQGIVSPSTLGIDVKKLDNAEAQREKEKATLYTRNDIVDTLQEILPKVVSMIFNCQSLMDEKPVRDIDCIVEFGEYANPSFESQVETVCKAKSGGIMSVEASVEELYGDTKEPDWKEIEVQRLKEEQGIILLPSVKMEGDMND
ncbi:MAG: capsid protein [Carnobacterium sp.]